MEKNFIPSPDRELVEMSEELQFDWPEVLPVERIKTGITLATVGLVMFVALMALCFSH